jgi:type VI secretion system protein ImpE
MLAEQSLRDGNIGEALAQLQDQVRKDPSNPKLRVFLFQLLAVQGEWDRALTQLNVAGDLDSGTLAMVQMYRAALECEAMRARVFAGERTPLIFGKPEQWIALVMEALKLTAQGHHAKAQALRDEAFETAPATSGQIDGQDFEWIADADMRLGPILEAVVNGKYYWVPMHRIRSINLEKPEDLRDMVWAPCQFTWANGGQTVGVIPARYAGSESNDDPLIRLSRKTDWIDAGDDVYLGAGQRMFATDAGEYPLLETRELTLNSAETPESETATETADG